VTTSASLSGRPYKVIATEEGFNIKEVMEAQDRYLASHDDEPGLADRRPGVIPGGPGLIDWEVRLEEMDRDGIDTQVLVLSSPGVQALEADEATALAALSNDRATEEAVRKYPGRFALLATIAPQDPAGAAKELERAMTTLGANGALVNSHTKGEYLDEEKFWPILEAAESLRAPIYIHPREPAPAMLQPYLKWDLATAVWGYAAEVSLHSLRLICSGVFDRFPNLKIVIGHAGENIPFVLDRIDNRYKRGRAYSQGKLKRLPSEYFADNFVVTTSGINWAPTVHFMQDVLGPDKVLFAVDYPFEDQPWTMKQVDSIDMPDEHKKMFFQTNAERVFHLTH
jgi:5-carboxyvanillate decarboxylase